MFALLKASNALTTKSQKVGMGMLNNTHKWINLTECGHVWTKP